MSYLDFAPNIACSRRTVRRNPLLRRRRYAFELPRRQTTKNRKRRLPSCKTRFAAEVMVGEGVSPLTVTPEPDVRLSSHPALEHQGHCHWYYHREYHREYSWRGSTARVLSWQAWRGWRCDPRPRSLGKCTFLRDRYPCFRYRLSGSSRGIPHIWGYGIIGEKSRRLCYAEHCGSQITRHDFNSFGYS